MTGLKYQDNDKYWSINPKMSVKTASRILSLWLLTSYATSDETRCEASIFCFLRLELKKCIFISLNYVFFPPFAHQQVGHKREISPDYWLVIMAEESAVCRSVTSTVVPPSRRCLSSRRRRWRRGNGRPGRQGRKLNIDLVIIFPLIIPFYLWSSAKFN